MARFSDVDPQKPRKTTSAAAKLNRRATARQFAVNSPDFQSWVGTLRKVEIDGETLYVLGGDMLVDMDQLAVDWLGRNKPEML